MAKQSKPVIYLIGSLRNSNVPKIAEVLRSRGFEVFDDWHSAGPEADDFLRDHYKFRGLGYKDAIHSYAAKHIFEFDEHHLNRADIGVLVMPAGKSGHLELGYMVGQGKEGYVLFDSVPDRVDIMYNFCTDVFFDLDEMVDTLVKNHLG
jgi:nucleoside 2-deoxyribosyltransferase